MYKPVFTPELRPRVLKTNINKITQYVIKRITAIGFDIYFSYSKKSKSRYLEIKLSEERRIIVRISDHPANKANRWQFKFDIHTTTQRYGSLDYIQFLDAFKSTVGERRSLTENIEHGNLQGKE